MTPCTTERIIYLYFRRSMPSAEIAYVLDVPVWLVIIVIDIEETTHQALILQEAKELLLIKTSTKTKIA